MLTRSDDITFQRTGEIQLRDGRKGLEFWAFNHEHGKPLHVGTLAGVTYEKTAPMLIKPERSFCLHSPELAAIEQAGGQFIRFIARGAVGTYSISLDDFKKFGERYFNAGYGYQIRVPVTKFQYTSKVSKRNKIVDSPVTAQPRPLLPDYKQRSLFG